MYVRAKKNSSKEILPKLYLTMGILAQEQDILMTKFIKTQVQNICVFELDIL